MRLYHLGDEGEPVRDIQDRLSALGYSSADGAGSFGDATLAAVEAFQSDRGLTVDGLVGPDTWRTLIEAGFSLGSRLLYRRSPMMRGDDVAELQRSLNSIGFDAGKVDGIFGPDTLRAVLDFQANRRLPEDGLVGPGVVEDLRLMTFATQKAGRETVRERQWLAALPVHLAGQRIYVDAYCRTDDEAAACWNAAVSFGLTIQNMGGHPIYSRTADTRPDEVVRAQRANRLGADFVVSFAQPPDGQELVLFFQSKHSHSAAGEKLAAAIADVLGLHTSGRSIPMLKDSRPPAIVVCKNAIEPGVGTTVAKGLADLLAAPREPESLDS